MKHYALAFLLIISAFASAAQKNQDLIDPKMQFHHFFKMGQSKSFRGRAQGLSAFNLDLQMYIHYKESLVQEGEKTFSLATDGNQIIHGTPVFPVTGQVVYEIKNSSGELEVFQLDHEEVVFSRKPFTLYLVESDRGYETRLARLKVLQEKKQDPRYENAHGRMVAVVHFDIQKQDIQFFQIAPDKNLIPSGVFQGSVAVPQTSYF